MLVNKCCSDLGRDNDLDHPMSDVLNDITQSLRDLAAGHLPKPISPPPKGTKTDHDAVDALNDLTESMRAARYAQQTDCELRHLAYAAAHDLRIPLRGISMISEWLERDYKSLFDEAGEELLALLKDRTHRMDRLLDAILDYCHAGVLKSGPVNTQLMIETLLEKTSYSEDLTINPEGPFPWIVGDRTRIKNVFESILDNAIRYMDKPDGEITIRCFDDENAWVFCIEDNGPGMDPDLVWEVFYVFHTLEPRHGEPGIGMGLALAKRIVEAHGGRIWIETDIDQGATVFFSIPKGQR